MKSKQLANVLIKMLGLSICLYAIPGVVSGVCLALEAKDATKSEVILRSLTFAIGSGVQALVGVVIIVRSRTVSG